MNLDQILKRSVCYLGVALLFGMTVVTVTGEEASLVDSQVVIADENDVAVASSLGAEVNITLMGFSSAPLVLDISSPLNPSLLINIQPLGDRVPFGAYLGLQTPADLYAAGAEAITEISSLQSL